MTTTAPFRAGVAPRSYVPVAAHEAVLAQFRQIENHGPAISLLVGDAGVGKSMLALKWLEAKRFPVYIPNAGLPTAAEFHRTLLHDLEKPGSNWFAVADALTSGPPKHLVLDDFDTASAEVLTELRRIDNLGVPTLVLGQPELADRLRSHAALASRVHAVIRVEPLTCDDAVQFVMGQCSEVEVEAATMIAELGHGVPRMMNRIAAAAMALGTIDVESVLAAVESLPTELFAPSAGSKRKGRGPQTASVPKQKRAA